MKSRSPIFDIHFCIWILLLILISSIQCEDNNTLKSLNNEDNNTLKSLNNEDNNTLSNVYNVDNVEKNNLIIVNIEDNNNTLINANNEDNNTLIIGNNEDNYTLINANNEDNNTMIIGNNEDNNTLNNLNNVTHIDSQSNETYDPCAEHFSDIVPEEDYQAPAIVMPTTIASISSTTAHDVMNKTEMSDEFFERFSEEFVRCPLIYIMPGCYEEYENGTVYVPIHQTLFNYSNYYIEEDSKELLICPDFVQPQSEKSTFVAWLSIISLTGIGISAVGAVIHTVTYLLLKELRNLPGSCLFSLCVALISAYTCIFARLCLPVEWGCLKLGEIMYFSLMASFFWMNVMSYDVWRALRLATSQLRRAGEKPQLLRFFFYSLYSWGVPMVILGTGLVLNHLGIMEDRYKLYFDRQTCWFRYKQALVVYFAVPIFTLLAANVIFFMLSSFMICSTSFRREGDSNVFMWSRFFASLRLAAVMGLTWIFGVLAAATQMEIFWYFYSFFTSMQGVFIFFGFTISDKTKKALKTAMKRKK